MLDVPLVANRRIVRAALGNEYPPDAPIDRVRLLLLVTAMVRVGVSVLITCPLLNRRVYAPEAVGNAEVVVRLVFVSTLATWRVLVPTVIKSPAAKSFKNCVPAPVTIDVALVAAVPTSGFVTMSASAMTTTLDFASIVVNANAASAGIANDASRVVPLNTAAPTWV
ncbi:MAG: hypothetical protein DDT26_01419 [Dehalococcoidia bacterium]|nr:hypothetical protein [Chloroflexota bacterium]